MVNDLIPNEYNAIVYQRHAGRALSKDEFFKDIIARVKKEIARFNMFKSKDNILVAVSGGKDSYVLLDVLLRIHEPHNLATVTVDEGIRGYSRNEQIAWVKELSNIHGFETYIISMKDYIGYSLSELVELADRKGLKISPCTYCGIIRRRAMNQLARELGFKRVVTAHTLDDEAQTALMNILRGDLLRLVQSHPKGPLLSRLFVRRVKPLRKIYEIEVTTYAYLKGFGFQETECPFITSRPTLRARLRKYLYAIESKNSGVLLRFLESVDELVKHLIPEYASLPELPRCPRCGEPMAYGREYCKLCELLEKLGIGTVPNLKQALKYDN